MIKRIEVSSPVVDAAVSSDARLAAFTDGFRGVRVYSLVTAEELWSQPTCALSVAFSPDGRFLATDCFEVGTGGHWRINVYDASSGRRMCQFTGHDTPFPGLVFAPDGLLYSYDQHGIIRAWNIDHQREQWCFSTLEWASNDPFFEEPPAGPCAGDRAGKGRGR
jgi:WD40 repeat protein